MAKKIVIGNWKMNPGGMDEAIALFEEISAGIKRITSTRVIVCPPYSFLESLASLYLPKIDIGAQDCFFSDAGSHTGEISPEMIKSVGGKYVILGHSERRALGDSDDLINKKVKSALASGLKVILCVGESARDESGEYLNYIKNQLVSDLTKIKKDQLKNLLIAYEPIWAIGKDATRSDNPQDVMEVRIFIKKILAEMFSREVGIRVPVIYGGSVETKNCHEYIHEGGVDGLLVGRNSLNAKKFVEIIKIVDEF